LQLQHGQKKGGQLVYHSQETLKFIQLISQFFIPQCIKLLCIVYFSSTRLVH